LILKKIELSGQILKKNSQTSNYIRSNGSRILPCGQTDRHDKANSRLPQFCERTYKLLLLERKRERVFLLPQLHPVPQAKDMQISIISQT
jgi:hypothetical protein